MKLGILGTRGIPNQYGGFEQLAENLSVQLAQRGHEVSVYCSSLHPSPESSYHGVERIICRDPESRLGTAGQFIYDLNCIRDARHRNFDVILQLGYTSSSVWASLLPKGVPVVTNMDGLEWKRSKYNKATRWFLRQAERWAVHSSTLLVADSPAIAQYLTRKYQRESIFIAYGATPFEQPSAKPIEPFDVQPGRYNMLIARMEPENHIEMIIKGHLATGGAMPLLVIGSTSNRYGQMLRAKYQSPRVKFVGPLYDLNLLNNIRYHCHLYFHGHSVGGTNPSLLEAMASQALIAAHDNPFNRAVLGEDAFYFSSPEDLATLPSPADVWKRNNLEKVRQAYSWQRITDQYENVLMNIASDPR
jgi:glycosyltransferase involved in cell wall biosynthesis